MSKVVFSSEALPAELDDGKRFSLWGELCSELFCKFEFERPDDRRFAVQLEYMPFGEVGVGRFSGTLNRVARSLQAIATDGSDSFCIGVNFGRSPLAVWQRGKECTMESGGLGLFQHSESFDLRAGSHNEWITLNVPRSSLLEYVSDAEDQLAAQTDTGSESMHYLKRYIGLLLEPDGVSADAALRDHVATTLLDLTALSFGARREAAEIAQFRGLRAARIQSIILEIRKGFSNPAFSARDVARKLRLAPHYVQNLLSETGVNFTDRVLELRLQKARAILTNPRGDHMKIGEIAFACGFNEVSYFNRCFRRRFGASPSEYRAGKGDLV